MYCDKCKSLSDIYNTTASAVRANARDEGWKHLAGKDTCPNCILDEIEHELTNNTQHLHTEKVEQ